MLPSIPISSSSSFAPAAPRSVGFPALSYSTGQPRFCRLRREDFGLRSLDQSCFIPIDGYRMQHRVPGMKITASVCSNGSPSKGFDYDLVIIGAGVGGHGAALHAVEKGLKTAIIEGDVVGGTCVNRGCVPSKALLAVSGRMRELQDEEHLKALGLRVSESGYDRQAVADHANNLASKIRGNLTNSMKALGVDILSGVGSFVGKQKVKYGKVGFMDTEITAKNIIIATGSVPFVPSGIEVDGKTVFTSDHALKLEWIPDWLAIVGSGYIGLEFSDVYTALGSEVTFVEALDQLMPGFDPEIGKLAQRILVNPRKIDHHVSVFAKKITPAKEGKPVIIELIDAKTKEPKDTLEVDAALIATGRAPFTKGLGLENVNVVTQRGFVPVNERMEVLDANGNVVPHVYCIGDANGKMMLAHAASAQGISVVEQVCGRDNVLNHLSVPAACFTHPEISFVINRPLHKKIKQINSTNSDLAITFADCSLNFGGPLDASMMLIQTKEEEHLQQGETKVSSLLLPNFEQVVPGISFGAKNSLDEAAELVENGILVAEDFRFFVGYAGWQMDQLRQEIESGYWVVAACSSDLICCSPESCSGLWGEILQLMGGRYSELSRKPRLDNP